jgi:hypothetical protein
MRNRVCRQDRSTLGYEARAPKSTPRRREATRCALESRAAARSFALQAEARCFAAEFRAAWRR